MLLKDVRIGMKVIPISKSIGMNLKEWLYWNDDCSSYLSDMGYLYVAQIEADGEVIINYEDKLSVMGGHFKVEDLLPAEAKINPCPTFKSIDIKALQRDNRVEVLVRNNRTGDCYMGDTNYKDGELEDFIEAISLAVKKAFSN